MVFKKYSSGKIAYVEYEHCQQLTKWMRKVSYYIDEL